MWQEAWPGVWPEGWPEAWLEAWPEASVRWLVRWESRQAVWLGPGLAAAVEGCQELWRLAQEPVHPGLEV